jgi:hypothetical protein
MKVSFIAKKKYKQQPANAASRGEDVVHDLE